MKKGKHKNLIGQKFGNLIVIKEAGFKEYKNKRYKDGIALCPLWLCKCDCGNECIVRGNSLTSGNTLSCGCLQKEKAAKAGRDNKKYNTYDLSGKYGIGYTNKGEEFYFDLEDYDKIKGYCWRKNHGYLEANDSNHKTIKMHRLLTDFKYEFIDHKNRKRYDNRKENLRPATKSENSQNQSKSNRNKTGFIGVNWRKRDGVWSAIIRVNGKQKWLGQFQTKEEAIKARLEAELKYYKEFAPQRHLFEQYGIEVDEINAL